MNIKQAYVPISLSISHHHAGPKYTINFYRPCHMLKESFPANLGPPCPQDLILSWSGKAGTLTASLSLKKSSKILL